MSEKQKAKHGGSRPSSGRKPVADKAKTVQIYPRQSRIDLLGKEKIQSVSLGAVEREYKKELKKKKE